MGHLGLRRSSSECHERPLLTGEVGARSVFETVIGYYSSRALAAAVAIPDYTVYNRPEAEVGAMSP